MRIQMLNNRRHSSLILSLLTVGAVTLGAVSAAPNTPPDDLVVAFGLPQEMPKPGPQHAWLATQMFVPGPDGKDYVNMEIEHKRKA